MELNPWVFVLLTFGMMAVIATCVAFIVKIIAYLVQRKSKPEKENTEQKAEAG